MAKTNGPNGKRGGIRSAGSRDGPNEFVFYGQINNGGKFAAKYGARKRMEACSW